jgi:phosphoribosylanthranilate isomerase
MSRYMKGKSQVEISRELQISPELVSLDLKHICEESAEQIQSLIQKELPLQFRKCRSALQFIQKVACEIAENPKPENARVDQLRMTALQLFGEAQEKEFALVADSTATAEALRFVSSNRLEQVMKKLKENNNDIPINTKESTKEN